MIRLVVHERAKKERCGRSIFIDPLDLKRVPPNFFVHCSSVELRKLPPIVNINTNFFKQDRFPHLQSVRIDTLAKGSVLDFHLMPLTRLALFEHGVANKLAPTTSTVTIPGTLRHLSLGYGIQYLGDLVMVEELDCRLMADVVLPDTLKYVNVVGGYRVEVEGTNVELLASDGPVRLNVAPKVERITAPVVDLPLDLPELETFVANTLSLDVTRCPKLEFVGLNEPDEASMAKLRARALEGGIHVMPPVEGGFPFIYDVHRLVRGNDFFVVLPHEPATSRFRVPIAIEEEYCFHSCPVVTGSAAEECMCGHPMVEPSCPYTCGRHEFCQVCVQKRKEMMFEIVNSLPEFPVLRYPTMQVCPMCRAPEVPEGDRKRMRL